MIKRLGFGQNSFAIKRWGFGDTRDPSLPPINKAATVALQGAAETTATLTAIVTDPNGLPANITYTWYRNGIVLGAVTSSTYTLTLDDVGAVITVRAEFTDLDGYAENVLSAGTDVVIDTVTPPEPTGLILHYKFNGDYQDSSVRANHGIPYQAVGFAADPDGQQYLDCSGGLVFTTNEVPTDASEISIAFWSKTTQKSGAMLVESSVDGYAMRRWYVALNEFFLVTNTVGELLFSSIYTRGVLANGSWSHNVFVVKKLDGGGYLRHYADGALVRMAGLRDTFTSFAPDKLRIGNRDSFTLPFEGGLRDLRIYNRALNEAEIQLIKSK